MYTDTIFVPPPWPGSSRRWDPGWALWALQSGGLLTYCIWSLGLGLSVTTLGGRRPLREMLNGHHQCRDPWTEGSTGARPLQAAFLLFTGPVLQPLERHLKG